MKLKHLSLRNFGPFVEFELDYDSRITRLVGVNGSGKTTVGLTAIWAGLKGIAEKQTSGSLFGQRFRFIGPSGKSSDIEITVIDERSGNTAKIKNHITSSSNSITFEAGPGFPAPEGWVENLLNAAFLSSKNFCALSSKEQALSLGIDTEKFDLEDKELKAKATEVNTAIRHLGIIEPAEKPAPVDLDALYKKREDVNRFNEEQDRAAANLTRENAKVASFTNSMYQLLSEYQKMREREKNIRKPDPKKDVASIQDQIQHLNEILREAIEFNQIQDQIEQHNRDIEREIENKKNEIDEARAVVTKINEAVAALPPPQPLREVTSIDEEIAAAKNVQGKEMAYLRYKDWVGKKNELDLAYSLNKASQDNLKERRTAFIKSFDLPFDGLSIDLDGGLLYNGRPLRDPYYSRGELEIIVAMLHASANPALKLRFLDDFESLDEDNQRKIVERLLGEGFQLIIAEVGQRAEHPGSVLLRECKIVSEYSESGRQLL